MWDVAKELSVDHSVVVWHLKQIGKVRKLDKWVPRKLTANQKTIVWKCHLPLSFAITVNHFSVDCDEWKVDFVQLAMTSSVVGPRRSSKALPKAKLAPEKVMVTFGGLLPVPSTITFWNHYIWDVCSADRWDAPKTAVPATGFAQQKGPSSSAWQCSTAHRQPALQKLNKLGCEVLHHLPYSPGHSPVDYHFFKDLDSFLKEKCFHNQQEAEYAFKSSFSPEALIFMVQE